ncbi:MAG: tetraacyldisaccharide 4'-kinase, partial [Bacteroidales bacterium]
SIIVSKCPESLNTEDQIKMIHNIKPLHTQSLFFSKIHYGKVIWQTLGLNNLELNANEVKADQTCVLFAGIAHPEPLCSYLQSLYKKVIPRYYEDHHVYTSAELLQFVKEASKYKNSVVICTEKDFMRLDNWDILKEYTSIPFGYLPIEVQVTDPKFSDYLLQKIAI